MKKKFLILFSFILIASCQNTSNPALVDPALKVEYPNLYDVPVYIINKDYVLYEDRYTHNIIYPDLATFGTRKEDEYAFAFDKNGIYVKGEFIKIDTTGFIVLGNNKAMDFLWKTKTKVFKNSTELKGVDAATFEPNRSQTFNTREDTQYYKDKNFIYYFDKKIEGSDGATANTYPNDFCHDKNYIYSGGEIAIYNKEPYQYVNYHFSKTKKYVFYRGATFPNMNTDSLTGLSGNYAKYGNSVYYEDRITPMQLKKNAKIKIWEVFFHDDYITDGTDIFYQGIKLNGKYDIASFGFFISLPCFYDKNGIYERKFDKDLKKDVIEKLPFKYTEKVSTANTFENKYTGILFYKNQAYDSRKEKFYDDVSKELIELAKKKKIDSDNLEGSPKVEIDYNFYKKDDRIYYADKRTGFDANSFTLMDKSHQYYKDKDVVIYCDRFDKIQKMKDVDVSSAKIFNSFLVDKNYLYCKNVKIIKSAGIELLAIFAGYRGGFCGNDPTPVSDFYLFKNKEGFWLVKISDEISYRFLGKVFDRNWDPAFRVIELHKKYGNVRDQFPQKQVVEIENELPANEIYSTSAVEVLPKYSGGIQKMYAFLKKNYVIPKAALEDDGTVSGVFASFVIEKDGTLSDIKVLHDYGYGSGKEMERVLKLLPNWEPAMIKGKVVRCKYSIPFYASNSN
ncbi:DKNYY domain-containing protein [Flavobacterium pectinovorum]|uniref:TonB C-terminal domain-containing protein n=1 Tax=Flavobacterium pectinovorum TaxID=29533 RepID=A0A502F6A3_9FLAO|nr:DKNYY domain-containing protein [Flavobacterium pectinovorum]TPG45212.1 hypothetical protein EAH81_00995 [Flavobacterium pectinovorum]